MSQLLRDAMILACAIAFAWFATFWARIGWIAIAVPESYSTTFAWLDYGHLSQWIFEFLWAAAFGILLTRNLRSRGALWWSLLIGLELGLPDLAFSHHYFAPDVSLSTYVWVYGQYVMPIAGAFVGSRFVARYWPRVLASAPNAA